MDHAEGFDRGDPDDLAPVQLHEGINREIDRARHGESRRDRRGQIRVSMPDDVVFQRFRLPGFEAAFRLDRAPAGGARIVDDPRDRRR